ncbi:MAG: hypothetical protein HC831_29570 [Chloroflexia bacterium]|nr:hypothetical protein [Chloroflexia bacterium]
MNESKENDLSGQFKAPLGEYFTVEIINTIIALLSCIIGISNLRTTIIFSSMIGEETPGILHIVSPVPLSYIIIELVKDFILVTGGFTLLIKKQFL